MTGDDKLGSRLAPVPPGSVRPEELALALIACRRRLPGHNGRTVSTLGF